MKSHTYWASALLVLALALWCTLGVSAEDTTTTASGTAGSFQLEQVYVNAPELDVYFYATDANGESYSPIVVQAQGVEATLGDRKLDTGMIGVADDPYLLHHRAGQQYLHRRRGFPHDAHGHLETGPDQAG